MYNGPNRKRQRLKEYDYSSNGAYFVTICTKNRENVFGEIIDGEMTVNEYGIIVEKEIIKTSEIRKEIQINNFVIMPNHLHLIIEIENVGNAGPHSLRLKQNINDFTKNYLSNKNIQFRRERLQSFPTGALGLKGNNLSSIIRGIKSSITNQIRKKFNDYVFVWQKSFYDEIIRDEAQFNKTIQYIAENPLKWEFDKNNLINIL